jgi:3-oxoacyl-[acyl-carrier protein] reductase
MSRRLALVAGGASGIGLGVACHLATNHDVAIAYAENHDHAEAARRSLAEQTPEAKIGIFGGRLQSYADCEKLVTGVTAEFGCGPDVLVNCTGCLFDQLFLGSDFEKHVGLIHEHLIVTMALCHLCLRGMYKKSFGRIVNIGSIRAQYAAIGQCSYAAAKAGIEGFSRTLALDVAHRGVTVNVVAPGLIDTPLASAFIDQAKHKGERTSWMPASGIGMPGDVGHLVAFLSSQQASYITGAVHVIDGGKSLGESPRGK